tara:strand:+ start:424 stop:984 length:561 start_codon:yes stop_codon:yes gene_type:complete
MDCNIICNKENILLKKNNINKNFILELNVSNNNLNLKNIISFKIYDLMAELNKDVIEKIEIFDTNTKNKKDILIIFKHICKEMGISKKYMFLETEIIEKNSNFNIIGISKDYNYKLEKCEQLKPTISFLDINVENLHKINLKYEFNIIFDEDMPIYMENMFALLMKKIFLNLKVFIENLLNISNDE